MASTSDSMKFYMRDINNIPLINTKEEVELAKLIKKGNQKAKYKLITSNLRLVVKIAHDFKGLGLPLQDLVAEGNIGLMRAAEKFDPSKGAKFSSYAAWWIKQSMRRAMMEKSKLIRVPITSAGKINKIKSTRSRLTEQLGRSPTDKEIAGKLNFSIKVVSRLKKVEQKTVSLQNPISNGENGWLKDILPDEKSPAPDQLLDESELADRINHLLSTLDHRERTILLMRFGLDGKPPKTLEEVSKVIGRTRERVRQIQNKALNKLRHTIRDENKSVAVGRPQVILN